MYHLWFRTGGITRKLKTEDIEMGPELVREAELINQYLCLI